MTSPSERWANLEEVLALAKYANVAMKATGAPERRQHEHPPAAIASSVGLRYRDIRCHCRNSSLPSPRQRGALAARPSRCNCNLSGQRRTSASPTISDRGESDEVKAPERGRASGAWRVCRLRGRHRTGLSVFWIM